MNAYSGCTIIPIDRALPAACLFAFSRPRVLGGFGAASLILLTCPSLPDWLRKLGAFNIEDERVQASLAGVWPGVFGSHHPGYLVVAAGALVASAFALKRGGSPVHTLALLLLIWFVAAPYSHAYDTTMLIVPIAVLGAYPSVLLVDCWVAAALSFYSLSTAVIVAPLLLIGYVAKLSQWRVKD